MFIAIRSWFILILGLAVNVACYSQSDFDRQTVERRAALKRMAAPAQGRAKGSTRDKAFDVLALTDLKGCNGSTTGADYMAKIATLPVDYPPDGPVEMFALPPLVRYLYQFGPCMSDAQKQTLLQSLTDKGQQLLGHGTLNHAIMRATSWYLLAQYFPDAKWTNINGKVYTSAQLMATLKALMMGRTHRFFESGQYEWLSPTYAVVNIFPLLNIIDFASDSELRDFANREATLEISILRAHSFHGVIVPPLTRKNYEQRNAEESSKNYPPSITQQALWYYFGEPTGLGLYDFQNEKEPYYYSILGASNWLPPKILNEAEPKHLEGYSIEVQTPSFGIWDAPVDTEIFGDSYISDDFAIGTGNLIFDPDGYSGHIQTFSILLKSNKPLNQIECYQPYWNSNFGQDTWGTDRSSPFQQMHRYDTSSVVMLFDIPSTDPWKSPVNAFDSKRDRQAGALFQIAQCRIPKNFDEIVTTPNWIFVREGNTFVAIATLYGTNSYGTPNVQLNSKFLVMKVPEQKTALFMRTEVAHKNYGFSEFQESVKKKLPKYDATTSSATFKDSQGVDTEVIFRLSQVGKRWSAIPIVKKDGIAVSRVSEYIISAPWIHLKQGVLQIDANGQSLKMDALSH